MITRRKYDSSRRINIHVLWSHFHLGVCLLLMKKMKRPADLMNSAARITTAFQTTGGVTARMTAETTQTKRTAVSSRVSCFLSARFVPLYTLLMFHTRLDSGEIGHLSALHPHHHRRNPLYYLVLFTSHPRTRRHTLPLSLHNLGNVCQSQLSIKSLILLSVLFLWGCGASDTLF